MTAKWKKEDAFIFITNPSRIGEDELVMIIGMFDEHTDIICQESNANNIPLIKKCRRICLVETLQFPFTLIITYLFNKASVKRVIKFQKIYWNFLTKKISIDETNEQLEEMMHEF